jgi:hypothetical protein
MAASRRTFRCFAVLAWLALFAQAVGIPIHLAADEHFHDGHQGDHVHFGAIGHGDHHAARHRAPDGGCDDESELPPHSAQDHLIDSIAPRHSARIALPAVDAIAAAPIALPEPRRVTTLLVVATDPAPSKPPPRRPEQSRAPPTLLV